MNYILLDDKKSETLTLKGELFKYIVKVRRHSLDEIVAFRYKEDMQTLYQYKIVDIQNRSLTLALENSQLLEISAEKLLHIGWCIIDPKSIEKVLPSLNEIGVSKISFIVCDRTQKNFKLDFKRFERILEASMQQCGRSKFMEFEEYKNIQEFIQHYPDTKVFDFCDNTLGDVSRFHNVLIGCEGGFSQKEREFLQTQESFRLNTPMILRSESAAVVVAGKILA